MENPVIIILVIAALIGGIFLVLRLTKKSKGKPLPPGAKAQCMPGSIETKLQSGWAVMKNTPNGSQVYSQIAFPDSVLAVVDRAVEFSIQVQKLQFPEWTKCLTPQEYEIWFVDSDGIAPVSKLPVLNIGGVPSAGTVSFCEPPAPQGERHAIILPDFSENNWTKEEDLFWFIVFEGEHRRELENDRNYARKFYGGDDSHPHKHEGKPSMYEVMPRGLMAKPVPKLACGFGVK